VRALLQNVAGTSAFTDAEYLVLAPRKTRSLATALQQTYGYRLPEHELCSVDAIVDLVMSAAATQ